MSEKSKSNFEAESPPPLIEKPKKDKIILITLNFKLWLARFFIAVFIIFYYLPNDIKVFIFDGNMHEGNDLVIYFGILYFIYLAWGLFLIIYVLSLFELKITKTEHLYSFFLTLLSFLILVSSFNYYLSIYNPLLFTPLFLSYLVTFYGTKYFKYFLIIYFIPLIFFIVTYFSKSFLRII